MRLRALRMLGVCVLASAAAQEPEERGSGLLYGKDHAYSLSAPTGWVLDNRSAVSQGLHAVFYPKGSSWTQSRVVMYANVAHKGDSDPQDLASVMEDDMAAFTEHAKAPRIADGPELLTKSKQKVVTKNFTDAARNVYETVAYIDESKVVVMLVLSAKSKQAAADAFHAFRQLVQSYLFVSDKVTYPGAEK